VLLVKGKLSLQGFEGRQASGLPTMQCGSYIVDRPPRMPELKVCYIRLCAQFAEIDPVLKLNTGMLGIGCWVGFCLNTSGGTC
jgi:hypothetical protein